MNPHQFNPQTSRQSSSGCGRLALVGAGCIVILIVGLVGFVVAANILWDRGSEPAVRWAFERAIGGSSDVSSRVEDADVSEFDIPDARSFDNRDEYIQAAEDYHREIGRAIEEIGRLLSDPDFQGDQWNDDLAQQLARIRHVRDQARDVEPPSELESVHEHWVNGVDGVTEAMNSVAEGLDDLSPSKLVEAFESLDQASRSYRSMTEALQEMD